MTDPRHRWGSPVAVTQGTPSGCQETERVCLHCAIARITVHYPQGFPGRAWRTAAGLRAEFTATPPCLRADNVEPLAVPVRAAGEVVMS